MESGLANKLVSVGIRTLSPHLKQQADKFDVEIIMMKDVVDMRLPAFKNPLYISIDLDVFDPAFAPGVSHLEAGGLSSRQLINILQTIKSPILGADIVELNPKRDSQGITTALAVKLLKEIVGLMGNKVI